MPVEFFSHEDAIIRLTNTVCLYNDIPVYIGPQLPHANNTGLLDLRVIGEMRTIERVSYSDPGFNCSNFKLGYVLCHDKAHFLARIPVRQGREGLHNHNIKSTPHSEHIYLRNLNNQWIKECLIGPKLSFKEALESCSRRSADAVFDRYACLKFLNRTFAFLVFRENILGTVRLNTGEFSSLVDYDVSLHLRELGVP